jgi:hypothetical protein
MITVETYFLITINEDGTLTSYAELPETLPEVKRSANNYDVYQASKQIVEEFDSNLLASKVAQTVLVALQPQTPNVSDAVKDKLKERGIDPESVTPTE